MTTKTRRLLTACLITGVIWMGAPAVADGPAAPSALAAGLAKAAVERTRHDVRYDGAYRKIPYPMGDVPGDVGVCTDLVVRAYRAVGIDLQRLVHEDMKAHFDAYPRVWGLAGPDANIDHRRVLNLACFFRRKGESLPLSRRGEDYLPGDLVTWTLPGNLPHIGIVVDRLVPGTSRPLVAHNIGRGPEVEDMLFDYPVTGHYRYPASTGKEPTAPNQWKKAPPPRRGTPPRGRAGSAP